MIGISFYPFLISVPLDVQMEIIVRIDGFRESSMQMWKLYLQKRKAGAYELPRIFLRKFGFNQLSLHFVLLNLVRHFVGKRFISVEFSNGYYVDDFVKMTSRK